MAIWGIGATWDREDIAGEFVDNNCVCIGYDEEEASVYYEMIKHVKIGDVICIKSKPIGQPYIYIKAIGIVVDNELSMQTGVRGTKGIKVKWLKDFTQNPHKIEFEVGDDKSQMHGVTFYQEYNTRITKQIIELI